MLKGKWEVVTALASEQAMPHRFAGLHEAALLVILGKCPGWQKRDLVVGVDWAELGLLGERLPKLEELQLRVGVLMDMSFPIETHAAAKARVMELMKELEA